MPRLAPVPRPPVPADGYPSNPINPDHDRYYILDDAGLPMRCFDHTEHTLWVCAEGKGWQIMDRLPEYAVDVWTYFAGWASLQDDKPPMFRTKISGSLNKCFYSETWEEAEDKHRRVLEKIRAALPRKD